MNPRTFMACMRSIESEQQHCNHAFHDDLCPVCTPEIEMTPFAHVVAVIALLLMLGAVAWALLNHFNAL